jgi:membrane-associated phospholipid phosphatase
MNYKWLVCGLLAASAALAQQPAPPCSEETAEPSKHLAKDIAKDILLDQKAIWTSPFHMTGKDAGLWLTFGAITGALIATDSRTTRQLPNTKDQLAFGRDVSQLGAIYTLVPAIGGLFLAGVLTEQPKLRETGLLGGEAVVDALIVSEVFKVATGRQRPLEGNGGGHFFHGSDSFPSGHTIESFALASVVAHQYHDNKAVVFLSYGLATLVGASRFSARQHFASDIVAGGVMGWFIGRHVSERSQAGRRSVAKAVLSPQVIPHVQPSDRSYGILLAWHTEPRQ